MDPSVPRSKRLLSDERSNIFVYMTGHGGNEFLKFQDNEEISAFDIADAFAQMYQKKRYVLWLRFPCVLLTISPKIQRTSLHDRYMPSEHDVFKVLFTQHPCDWLIRFGRKFIFCASLSVSFTQYLTRCLFKHANDYDIGVAVIDAYTHYVLEFMENINKTSQASMEELVGRLLLLSASTKRPKLSS